MEQQGLPEFPIDHALAGSLLAQSWLLPKEICLAIRHHHDISVLDSDDSGLPDASLYMIALGQTAEHILQEITGGSRTQEWSKLGSSCLRLLDFTEVELQAIYDQAGIVIKAVDLIA